MPWMLAMDWVDALFLHWPIDAAQLRAHVPRDLAIDEFDGSAWIGIVAFRITAARPRGVPRRLGFPAFPEVNVRTYVTGGGHAGVWFFSLDAGSRLAVAGGRRAVHLPYHHAKITTAFSERETSFRLDRVQHDAPPARLAATATFGDGVRTAAPGTLEHRLAERYCFFTVDRRGRTLRGDVQHHPWPLRDAEARVEENTLISALGLEPARATVLAHVSSGVSTRAWPLR